MFKEDTSIYGRQYSESLESIVEMDHFLLLPGSTDYKFDRPVNLGWEANQLDVRHSVRLLPPRSQSSLKSRDARLPSTLRTCIGLCATFAGTVPTVLARRIEGYLAPQQPAAPGAAVVRWKSFDAVKKSHPLDLFMAGSAN